jgi:hypothetical protein
LQGVLAQAKNGDQVLWEEKFHATNGKAQPCTRGALLFILSCLGGWGIFSYFLASQCVRNMFPSSSQWVPKCSPVSQCFPQHVLHTTSLLSHMPWKWCTPFRYIGGPKGRKFIFQNRAFCLGESPQFHFFQQWPIKLACHQKIKIKTCEAPHLINRRDDYVAKFISLP